MHIRCCLVRQLPFLYPKTVKRYKKDTENMISGNKDVKDKRRNDESIL